MNNKLSDFLTPAEMVFHRMRFPVPLRPHLLLAADELFPASQVFALQKYFMQLFRPPQEDSMSLCEACLRSCSKEAAGISELTAAEQFSCLCLRGGLITAVEKFTALLPAATRIEALEIFNCINGMLKVLDDLFLNQGSLVKKHLEEIYNRWLEADEKTAGCKPYEIYFINYAVSAGGNWWM